MQLVTLYSKLCLWASCTICINEFFSTYFNLPSLYINTNPNPHPNPNYNPTLIMTLTLTLILPCLTEKLKHITWNLVVFDEGHKMKNPQGGLQIAARKVLGLFILSLSYISLDWPLILYIHLLTMITTSHFILRINQWIITFIMKFQSSHHPRIPLNLTTDTQG